ncbi:MAG: hypothetical protein WBV77_17475 [Solirubrobacteraceae bacterium]
MAHNPVQATARSATSDEPSLTPEGLWLASELLRSPSLEVSSALISIATALVGCDTRRVLDTLDNAAIDLFGAQPLPLQAQAQRLGYALANTLALTPGSTDHRGLLIDQALSRRQAHPVLIAAIGHELARRAGLRSQLCVTAEGWWTALIDQDRVILVGSGDRDLPASTSNVRYACPHQLAGVILSQLARHRGQPWSDRASQLERSLPLCHPHNPQT